LPVGTTGTTLAVSLANDHFQDSDGRRAEAGQARLAAISGPTLEGTITS